MKSTTRLKAVAGTDIAAAAPKYEYDRILGLVRLLEDQLQWFDFRRHVLDDFNLPDQFWDEVAEATYEATQTKIRKCSTVPAKNGALAALDYVIANDDLFEHYGPGAELDRHLLRLVRKFVAQQVEAVQS